MSSYDYNNAATSSEAAFLEFYPFTTSPTTSSAGAVSPSTAIPGPPTTLSSAMSSPISTRQPQGLTWDMPFDFVAPVAGTAVQSPIEGPLTSPEDSPQTMSPAHVSSTASSPNQQLLSPFQGTMDFNAHDSLTAVTLQQNQRQFQSSAALQLQQHNFLQQHRQFQQQQHHQRQLQQQQHHQQRQQQRQQQAQNLQPFVPNPATTAALMAQAFNPFATAFPNPALDYLTQTPATTAALEASIQLGTTFHGLPSVTGPGTNASASGQALPYDIGMGNWQDYELVFNPASSLAPHRLSSVGSLGSNSPTGTNIEVHSLGSSSGEVDWTTVEMFPHFDSFPNGAAQSIFNPGQTLHLRTNSDSSQSEGNSYGSFEDISFAPPFSPFSGASDSSGSQHNCFHGDGHNHGHAHGHSHSHSHNQNHGHSHHHHSASQELVLSPAAAVSPVQIKTAAASASPTATALIASTRQSPTAGSGVGPTSSLGSSSSSTPARRASNGPRKSPIAKPGAKAVVRRSSTGKDGKLIPGEKKVGRRRGPLLPEQRKQASEIRKLRACLRCKFLKKTCDKGEPCAGCQPSHARLWQVPCTRIDIKDVGFFMKDWRADYERHLDVGMSVYNVKGFAKKERLMWITHGYGFCLPVMVREVMVADESCFQLDWVESYLTDQEPIDFGIRTEKLDVGEEGISMEKLSTYLDHHIDGTFETFVDDHFEGTPFVTEVLKTAHRYYMKEKQSVIRKALKLVLAYNLTMHITLVEQQGSENPIDGQIDDEDSKFFGKTVAPVMINFQIKCAMADMWRELQKEILEELSGLYSRVYSGDRLKNWPTIFMLAAILLIVWEEMQFDCHYRVPDANSVQKFCGEMESTPVGVIVGLFHAISQKLPAFTDWDTEKHGQVLNNNEAVCEAMTDMRKHIASHDTYLRSRQNNTEFDRHDFDSLSNKFLSKLVIRAN